MLITAITQRLSYLMMAVLWVVSVSNAWANTFEAALKSTYENNPQIKAQRQSLQAVDESVSQAFSGFRPTITGTYDYGPTQTQFGDNPETNTTSNNKVARFDQPLFRGGSTFATLNSARQRVKAGRNQLLSVEQSVMLDAITSYMDVVQAQAILELSRANQEVLAKQLQGSKDRFAVGDVTRTDVAQSEARLSNSRSAVIAAEGQVIATSATFQRLVGYKPEGLLDVPQKFPEIPVSLEDALHIASNQNPALLAAIHAEKSARYDVNSSIGTILPQVSLVGSLSRTTNAGITGNNDFDQNSLLLNVRVPLYQAGSEYSRVREAKARMRQRREETDNNRITIEENTTRAWEQLETSIATIAAREDQIRAAEVAFDGVKQEQEYGARTVLDVLDAEQELFNAKTNLVRAQRDRIVAVYNLLATLGRLTPENLEIGIASYDPKENYNAVEWLPAGF